MLVLYAPASKKWVFLRLQNGKISLEMPKNVKIRRLKDAYFGSQIEALKVPLAKRPKTTDKPKDEKKGEKDEKDELLIVRFLEYRGSVSDNLGVSSELFYSFH